MIKFMQ